MIAKGRNIAKLLVGCFTAVVVLGVMNVLTAGTKHVETVIDNKHLKAENGKLKEENLQLKTNSNQFSTEQLESTDSLVKAIEDKELALKTIEQDVTVIKNQLEHEKRNSIVNPYNTTPYQLEPIELPSSESN